VVISELLSVIAAVFLDGVNAENYRYYTTDTTGPLVYDTPYVVAVSMAMGTSESVVSGLEWRDYQAMVVSGSYVLKE
jgi:hypothetical protein